MEITDKSFLAEKMEVTSPADPQKLRILSYNFFLRPPLVNNNGEDYKNERITCFTPYFPDFSIICFQEVFSLLSSRHKAIVKNAKAQNFQFTNMSPAPKSRFCLCLPYTNSGLLTISRNPITDKQFQGYTYATSADALSWKGLSYSEIRPKNSEKILHVINTHLQAQYNPYSPEIAGNKAKLKKSGQGYRTRLTQAFEIRIF
jgi:hypothetical protein